MKIIRKAKEVGLANVVSGFAERAKYKRLIRKYHFDTWHLSPYQWRKYVQETAKYLNKHNAGVVVDIGCGLGGLLRHSKASVRIGIDLHENVIQAARELGDSKIIYRVGSFEKVEESPVDYLVTLGFMHGSVEETWVNPYRRVAEKNQVKHFVVDTVPEEGTSHFLDWEKILPPNYKRIEHMGPFLGGRYVEIWEKQ